MKKTWSGCLILVTSKNDGRHFLRLIFVGVDLRKSVDKELYFTKTFGLSKFA